MTLHTFKAQALLIFYPHAFQPPTLCEICIHLIAHSKKIFLHPPNNTSKYKATRKLFPQATPNSPTSSSYNPTPTASPNISNLPDANEVMSRPQRNRKAPTLFGEPIPSDLIHKFKKK